MYAPTTSKASTTSQGTKNLVYIITSRESKAPKTNFNDIYTMAPDSPGILDTYNT